MNKLMKIFVTTVFVSLALSTQTLALDPDELLAIHEAMDKAFNAHDFDAWLSYFTDDGVLDWPASPPPMDTKEKIRAFLHASIDPSPDFHTTEGPRFAVDNKVVVEHLMAGTVKDEWQGFPAAGKAWQLPHIDIYEFEGDKVKRLTTYTDMATYMIQLGLMPMPDIPELVPSISVPDHEPTGLSPLEANAEHIRRWNSHDAALMAQIYHADAKIFAGPLGAEVDRVAMTAMNEMYFSAFPNIKQEVVRTIDLGDNWVLTELVALSTHQGPFMSVPPSGYPMEIRNVWLVHYSEDGLVTQGSFYYDNMTLMTQMTTPPEFMPDGTWVVTLPTPVDRNATFLHTVSPQGKMGGSFAGIMVQVNKNPTLFGMFPEAEDSSAWLTKTVWAGRKSVETINLAYGTKKGESPLTETVTICIARSEWTLTGPNTNEGTAVLSMYLAEQDVDGDGFPDPGEEPVACVPYTFTSRRLTMMPGCVPPPVTP